MTQVTRILGVDPGSRLTGWGIIDLIGNQMRSVAHGTLKIARTYGTAEVDLDQRLLLIHRGLAEVIQLHRPHVMSVEKVFFAKNAVSALKLGQARGAVILTGAIAGLPFHEYSVSEVKAAVTGHGQADKEQVAKMVAMLTGLNVKEFATLDASDGMALAICHAQNLAARGRALPKKIAGSSRNKRMSLAEACGVDAQLLQKATKQK